VLISVGPGALSIDGFLRYLTTRDKPLEFR
jgi:hypothetical protein